MTLPYFLCNDMYDDLRYQRPPQLCVRKCVHDRVGTFRCVWSHARKTKLDTLTCVIHVLSRGGASRRWQLFLNLQLVSLHRNLACAAARQCVFKCPSNKHSAWCEFQAPPTSWCCVLASYRHASTSSNDICLRARSALVCFAFSGRRAVLLVLFSPVCFLDLLFRFIRMRHITMFFCALCAAS